MTSAAVRNDLLAGLRGGADLLNYFGHAGVTALDHGLFSVAEMASRDVVALFLSHGHTVDYGKWLEVAHAGRYAVIMPTMEKWIPEIERQLKALLR